MSQSLHISGAKVASDIQMDANASTALQHLKEQLLTYQVDNKKLSDQLNCLVSLIKRSWTGDKHATIHLSNIIGMEPPQYLNVIQNQEGMMARPNSQVNKTVPQTKTRCEQNWERLALKLLERDYHAVEEEIREYQQRYIENRQAYMDAVLQDHKQSMSRINLHKKTDSVSLDEFDSRFIKHNQALQRMGSGLKAGNRRVQSAGARRRVLIQDKVERMDISLRDLVSGTPSSNHFTEAQARGDAPSNIQSMSILRRPQSSHPSLRHAKADSYNDAGRYLQNNLFTLNENDGIKKPRPVSASSLRDGDIARSRPRSGHAQADVGKDSTSAGQAFITQRNERSLKYETTRPVIVKPKSAKARRNSAGAVENKPPSSGMRVSTQPQTDIFSATMKQIDTNSQDRGMKSGTSKPSPHDEPVQNTERNDNAFIPQQADDDSQWEDDAVQMEETRPAVSVRVKSGFTRRPKFIDEFSQDEKVMKDMEADFKKTALTLQKKLGIDQNGYISF